MNTNIPQILQPDQPVYVTTGFLSKFEAIKTDCDVSFKEIAKLISTQPHLVWHLLHEANMRCEKYKSAMRPKSIHCVINVLGLCGTIDACYIAQEIPEQEAGLFNHASGNAYVLAVVLSQLAERCFGLGRRYAADFFLNGLIASQVMSGDVSLASCNEDIVRYFGDNPIKGHPRVAEALQVILNIDKGRISHDKEMLFAVANARDYVRYLD